MLNDPLFHIDSEPEAVNTDLCTKILYHPSKRYMSMFFDYNSLVSFLEITCLKQTA